MAINKRLIAGAPTGGGGACTTNTLQILGDSSCIAYYKMADATDESGSHNGTPSNVNFNVEGKYGLAGEFNGSSSKIVLPNSSFQTSAFTVSAWCNVTANGSENSIFEFTDTNSGNNQSTVLLSAGNASNSSRFLIRNTTSNEYSHAPSGTPATGWNHYCLTFDGSTAKSYINGSEVNSASFSITNTIASTSEVLLGLSATDRFLNGKIDQVRLFNKAVSASEVGTLYNEVQCASTVTPSAAFNTVIYTGGNAPKTVTGTGFESDFIWIKNREDSSANHYLIDSVRGIGSGGRYKFLSSDLSQAENATTTNHVSAINNNGFILQGNHKRTNASGEDYVAWNWYAPTSETNNAGSNGATIASTIKKNIDAGFSIVKYEGSGATATVGHGLGSIVELLIVKGLETTNDWSVLHKDGANGNFLQLNGSSGQSGSGSIFGSPTARPTDSVFTIGNTGETGTNGKDYIAYCFHSVEGYSRIGFYIGDRTNDVFVVTGFEPAWVMIKAADASDNWFIVDNKREGSSAPSKVLLADTADAESNFVDAVRFTTNGFQLVGSANSGGTNNDGTKFIFMAFAQDADTTPATKADSFEAKTYSGNNSTQEIDLSNGMKPDFTWIKSRSGGVDHNLIDSVRGNFILNTNRSIAQEAGFNGIVLDDNGFTVDASPSGGGTTVGEINVSGQNYISWNWKAADHDRSLATINQDGSITSLVSANKASGFSIVKYTGTGSTATVGHGIDAPEMIIAKSTSDGYEWKIWHKDLSSGYQLLFNTAVQASDPTVWTTTNPTSTVFSVGTNVGVNQLNKTYIAYCFHSVASYQKVGSYTGTGATGNSIYTTDNGQSGGANGFEPSFVMLKVSTANDNWLMYDNKRGVDVALFANLNNAEDSYVGRMVFNSNGFTLNTTDAGWNGSGQTYIYLAIA